MDGAEIKGAPFPQLDSVGFLPHRFRPGSLRTWSGHLPFARDLVGSLRPELLVELGTHWGESYFGFCQSVAETCSTCKCYAVDTWRGDAHAGEYGEEVYAEVERYNRERYPGFSYLLRTTFDDAASKFSEETIDLLHIDGLHTYAAVRHDWDTWFPKVAPGGIVLLHDIHARHVDFGVWKLWDEISGRLESFEFHHSFGLGVIRKPGPSKHADGILNYIFSGANADAIRRHYVAFAERLDLRADLAVAHRQAGAPLFQVYYPEGGSFSEAASETRALETGRWQKVTLELTQGIEGSTLRLDPVDRPAVIDIGSIALSHAFDRRELWRCRPQEAGDCIVVSGTAKVMPGESSLRVFSYGLDPWIFVTVPKHVPRGEPLVIECWIRLHADFAQIAALIDLQTGIEPLSGSTTARTDPDVQREASGSPGLWVDPGEDALERLTSPSPAGQAVEECIELSLDAPSSSKNDWIPVADQPGTWRCMTCDPWVICPAADLASYRLFILTMSCNTDSFEPHAQLFWQTKDCPGFEEHRSVRFQVVPDAKVHSYVLDLAAQPGNSSDWSKAEGLIRIDPLDSPGEFRIVSAALVHEHRAGPGQIGDLLESHPKSE